MATATQKSTDDAREDSPGKWEALEKILGPLASLKLTVVLFAMAIFIVFAGTLAQVEKDIWQVIDEYFRMKLTSPLDFLRSSFAWIEFQIFFPQSFFPSKPQVGGGFLFPKGWLIGLAMAINLLSAHAVRFKVQARGPRLAAGLGVIALGIYTTLVVIVSGSNKEGFQAVSSIPWSTVWRLFEAGLAALLLTCAGGYLYLPRERRAERWLSLGLSGALAAGLAAALLYDKSVGGIDDSSMRILWQLIKATFAGLVLLAGCILVFKKRGGVVLLHGGIGLMMLSEVLVGVWAVEGQLSIAEGQTGQYVQDIRAIEMAIVRADEKDAESNVVTVVPQKLLTQGETIRHEELPFEVRVEEYVPNSELRDKGPNEKTAATAGAGQKHVAKRLPISTGTDADTKVDYPSAYMTLVDKEKKELGTYLVSLHLRPQRVEGTPYDIELRFKRDYKPYSMKLLDVRKDDYVGTDTARNYSSDVRLVDARFGVDRDVHIWMNNPLRYAGETFYQSNYFRDPTTGKEYTTLQVVTNTGWMIPYVSCMIVAVGMFYHFGLTLIRFLNRRAAPSAAIAPSTPALREKTKLLASAMKDAETQERSPWPVYVTAAVLLLGMAWVARKSIPPRVHEEAMDLYRFGQLPVAYEGRVKPMDTLARTSLLAISHKQTFKDQDGQTQPALRWLLDVIANPDAADEHKVFRIEHKSLLGMLGLKEADGFRYSIDDLRPKLPELIKQAQQAPAKSKDRSTHQQAIVDLAEKLRFYMALHQSFSPLDSPQADVRAEVQFLLDAPRVLPELTRSTIMPLSAPPLAEGQDWTTLPLAAMRDDVRAIARRRHNAGTSAALAEKLVADVAAGMEKGGGATLTDSVRKNVATSLSAGIDEILGPTPLVGAPNPVVPAMAKILKAYENNQAATFNDEVAAYREALTPLASSDMNESKIRFEAYFNHVEPFFLASMLYLFAFALAVGSWLGWTEPLNRAAFWLIVATLVLHTLALVGRIYISGRPPVTNLYTTAVFIGWAALIMGIVFEVLFRIGVGNVVAAVGGSATLFISHFLALQGDTFKVLVAVLDTNFWLATHVVTINLGYATTMVAGLLGLIYVLRGVFTRSLTPEVGKDISRMIYGTLCFATFFSFVGTVLGGLWADDSWGRFWGWDPKENGALIIVLWNALVIHARWGALVKDRGVAVLSVVGNIVTAWSWFGVNQLGAGLHAYGFDDRLAFGLTLFVLSQLAIITAGCVPRRVWASKLA